MSDAERLNQLRAEIDRIDDSIHDLILERVELFEEIRRAKPGGGLVLRPAREAQILRRLVGRHSGALPPPALVRIWREMISGLCRLQGDFRVIVCAPDAAGGYWDMARDHYGGTVTLESRGTPQAVLASVRQDPISVGVLPTPDDSAQGGWWTALLSEPADGLRVVARLPFIGGGNARPTPGVAGLVVARLPFESSGEDWSLVIFEDVEKDEAAARIAAQGLGLHAMDRRHDWVLAAIEAWLSPDDPRLSALGARLVGGYAVPLEHD